MKVILLALLIVAIAGSLQVARAQAQRKTSAEAEIDRYSALIANQDPEAGRVILDAAEKWATDAEYNFSTMELLARLNSDEAFDALQKLMRHKDSAVRKRAYAMLAFYWPADGRKLDSSTEEVAIRDLKSNTFPNLDSRFAVRTLARSSGSQAAVDVVVKALVNPEKDTRLAAAYTLGLLGDQKTVNALLTRAANDIDEDVRAACYRALADLGNETGTEQLTARLAKADPETLLHARQFGTPAERRLAQAK